MPEGRIVSLDEEKFLLCLKYNLWGSNQNRLKSWETGEKISSSPAAVAGYPSITLPVDWIHGLRVGISFIGRAWSEPVLIRLAYGLERALGMRKAPRFLTTAEIPASGPVRPQSRSTTERREPR